MRVLLIEDDSAAAAFLVRGLQESGHSVMHAENGEFGLAQALGESFEVMIVDRMLPLLDGLALIRMVREQGIKTPALILSALGEIDDRVAGLRSGGDDYLVKPYAFAELLARIEALSRRSEPAEALAVLRVADLELDRFKRSVRRGGQTLLLQPREFRLLEYLMQHAGQVVTRTMLLEHVWNYHFDPQTNVIDVHISRLRAKLDRDFDPPLLHTIRGAGYCLRELE